jgi:hypothetical protein
LHSCGFLSLNLFVCAHCWPTLLSMISCGYEKTECRRHSPPIESGLIWSSGAKLNWYLDLSETSWSNLSLSKRQVGTLGWRPQKLSVQLEGTHDLCHGTPSPKFWQLRLGRWLLTTDVNVQVKVQGSIAASLVLLLSTEIRFSTVWRHWNVWYSDITWSPGWYTGEPVLEFDGTTWFGEVNGTSIHCHASRRVPWRWSIVGSLIVRFISDDVRNHSGLFLSSCALIGQGDCQKLTKSIQLCLSPLHSITMKSLWNGKRVPFATQKHVSSKMSIGWQEIEKQVSTNHFSNDAQRSSLSS